MNEKMSAVKCFLLDMDGTIYLDDQPFEGAVEAVERMKKRGTVLFLTNNSSRTADEYVAKLNALGFSADKSNVYTSSMAAVQYLNARYGGARTYVFANDAVKREFASAGINCVDDNPQIALIAFNTSFYYDELEKLCNFIREGVPYICTHDDINCPTVRGYKPDVGSYIALIEKSTGIKPLAVCGKPYAVMGNCIKSRYSLQPMQIAMFGDRLATDIRFGCTNNFVTTLVLTGEATEDDAKKSGLDIDFILPSVCDWDK